MRKILYTKEYGVGWVSSCNTREIAQFSISYLPIVEAIERGEKLDNNDHCDTEKHKLEKYHPAVQQFIQEARAKFAKPDDPEWVRYTPYLGILNSLAIKEVPDGCLVKIEDCDGKEYVNVYYPDLELY